MLNTSLHNRSASMTGSFTYENFYHNLNGAMVRSNMPDSAIIRVGCSKEERSSVFI